MAIEQESTHQIRMFGPFAISHRGTPIPRHSWGRQKSLAIAKYLIAHRGQAVRVERLAKLFYPGKPLDQVQANLRARISEIRRALWPDPSHPDAKDGLRLVEGPGYRFDPQAPCWIDIEWFERHLEAANDYFGRTMWQAALEHFTKANALYRGDFLIDDLDEEWTQDIRERLNMAYQSSLLKTAECHLRLGQYQLAAASAQRAREIDPLDEEAYRLQILALGHMPDKAAVTRVYQALVEALREIEVEPDPEIKELVQQIRRGTFRPSAPAPRHNLRPPLTPFFGRDQELAELTERLTDAHTRLVTLLGPGGIGKSRLAVEAGQKLIPSFRNGVFWVSAPEHRSSQSLAVGIAQAVGYSINRPADAVRELTGYLLGQEILIIIDAAEHVSDGAQLLAALLSCPGLKLLVTSRQRLHVQGEYIIDVLGLPFPREASQRLTQSEKVKLEASPAYRLFVDRYTRVQPRFRPADQDLLAIAHVCRLVDGMPLAIEIAASWGRAMTCQEIAARVAAFDILADALDDQHCGIHLVFTLSWQMLSATEQRAAMRASTFAGSFSMDAAERVTGFPVSILMSLSDKSFVQWEPNGRFRLHEVIRRYLRRELSADQAAEEHAYREHAAYFAERISSSDPLGQLSHERLLETRDERSDIQQAWRWWLDHDDIEKLRAMNWPIGQVLETADQWTALVELLQDATTRYRDRIWTVPTGPSADSAPDGPRTVAGWVSTDELNLYTELLIHLGKIATRIGELPLAQNAVDEASELLERTRDRPGAPAHSPPVVAMHRYVWGWLLSEQGDGASAEAQLTQAAEELGAVGAELQRANTLSTLASLVRVNGDMNRALELYRECLAIYQRYGDTRAVAGALTNLGSVHGSLGNYDESERFFKEARRYADEGGHLLIKFYAVGNCGFLFYKQSRLDEAEELCREAYDVAVEIGFRRGQANIAYYLALIALDRRQPKEALPYLLEAVDLSVQNAVVPLTLQALHGVARYLALTGEGEQAAALLHYVLGHPAHPRAAAKRSEEVLAELAPALDPDELERARRKASEATLEALVAEVRALAQRD